VRRIDARKRGADREVVFTGSDRREPRVLGRRRERHGGRRRGCDDRENSKPSAGYVRVYVLGFMYACVYMMGEWWIVYVCVRWRVMRGVAGTSSLALFGLLRRRPLNDETASGDVVKGVERARLALGLAFTLGIVSVRGDVTLAREETAFVLRRLR